ncbi:ATP-binding protein [Thalassiella azotivora]
MTTTADTAQPTPGLPADRVDLHVPADPAYLAVLRTATAGLAARLDLTLDEIEDLRIAVDEASALVLHGAAPDDELRAVFELGSDTITVTVTGPAPALPPPDSVAWAVLGALVGHVETGGRPGAVRIRLHHLRVVRS